VPSYTGAPHFGAVAKHTSFEVNRARPHSPNMQSAIKPTLPEKKRDRDVEILEMKPPAHRHLLDVKTAL